MQFGARFNADCENLRLAHIAARCSGHPNVSGCVAYFVSGRAFRCSFDQCKCPCYRAFNAVFSKVGRFASEEVVLDLIRNKCLAVLLLGVEACRMLVRDKRSLAFTVTCSLMKLFQTGSATVVCDCMNFFTSCQSVIK